ncbi:MinD/ParA family protein [Halomicroarcula sp. GCM10025709]|uniref:MinD/ParA family ATP-binding protein n=1 Tax=Haloarcula TaxID=2237 RepID=UPI0024C2331C|nr:AAA family ATPase [Halomicroarcula sp. YJ-61-S]
MLAIAGGKGGCGKTTTALGIASELGARGSRPLVVDADRQMPDIHHRVGIDRTPGLGCLGRAALSRLARRPSRFPRIDAVPCGTADRSTLSSALARLRGRRRPVLVDCPAGAGPDAAVPLRHADASIVVATPTEQSLRDAAKTAAMARELDAPPSFAVLTRSDGSTQPGALLGCRDVVHVPEVSEPPLEARAVAVRYAAVATRLAKRNI